MAVVQFFNFLLYFFSLFVFSFQREQVLLIQQILEFGECFLSPIQLTNEFTKSFIFCCSVFDYQYSSQIPRISISLPSLHAFLHVVFFFPIRALKMLNIKKNVKHSYFNFSVQGPGVWLSCRASPALQNKNLSLMFDLFLQTVSFVF